MLYKVQNREGRWYCGEPYEYEVKHAKSKNGQVVCLGWEKSDEHVTLLTKAQLDKLTPCILTHNHGFTVVSVGTEARQLLIDFSPV